MKVLNEVVNEELNEVINENRLSSIISYTTQLEFELVIRLKIVR